MCQAHPIINLGLKNKTILMQHENIRCALNIPHVTLFFMQTPFLHSNRKTKLYPSSIFFSLVTYQQLSYMRVKSDCTAKQSPHHEAKDQYQLMITNQTVFIYLFPKLMNHVLWYLFMPVMRMAYHPYQLNHAQQFCRNIGGYRAINKSFSSHFWSSRSLVLKGANLTPILMIYYSIVILNLLPIHKRLFR